MGRFESSAPLARDGLLELFVVQTPMSAGRPVVALDRLHARPQRTVETEERAQLFAEGALVVVNSTHNRSHDVHVVAHRARGIAFGKMA